MAFTDFSTSTFNSPDSRGSGGPKPDGNSVIPDPFVLYSTTHMPTNMEDVLRLAEYTWLTSSQYTQALRRAGRYFITKLVFSGADGKEQRKYEEFFNDHLNVLNILENITDDFLCFGNSFTSLYLPFNRIVTCKKCRLVRSIDKIDDRDISLDQRNLSFMIKCVKCGTKELHSHKDLLSTDESKVNVVRWNPHEIRLLHNFVTGETTHIWEVSADLKVNIKENRGFYIKKTPWEIIEAAASDRSFRFSEGTMFHMKEPVISGVRNRGWGIPKIMASYKDAYYVQVLKRYNEALAMDYIVPFRLVTPAVGGGGVDPLLNYDLSEWSSSLRKMLDDHRSDPAGWHTAPFPVNYQILGAEGQSLSPWQLIKQGTSDLLDSLGVPMELFQGTLKMQTAPTALRLFESSWSTIVTEMNNWLSWLANRMSNVFGWQPVTVRLQPVAYADNIERKSILLQLASAQEVSKQTAFSPMGLNVEEEMRSMQEELSLQNEITKEFEENEVKKQELADLSAQNTQAGQAPMQPGMDPNAQQQPGAMISGAGQGGAPGTPQDLMGQAQTEAQQILTMPSTQRISYLRNLKAQNPMLHSQVKAELGNMEQQAASAGIQSARSGQMQ